MSRESKENDFLPTMFDHLQMPGKTSEDWKKYQKGQYREETLPTDGTRSHCFLSIMSRFQHLTQSMHLRRIEMWPTSTSHSYSHNNLKTYLFQNCFFTLNSLRPPDDDPCMSSALKYYYLFCFVALLSSGSKDFLRYRSYIYYYYYYNSACIDPNSLTMADVELEN